MFASVLQPPVQIQRTFGVATVAIFCASDPALTGLHGSERARNIGAIGEPPVPDAVLAALETLA